MSEKPEIKEEVSWISGEYLTHACYLVALQITDGNKEDQAWEESDMPEFKERMTYLMRQHAPIAYAYFFDKATGDEIIPHGTIEIIIKLIRKQIPEFMGGKIDSGIIIPTSFRG